MEKEFVPYELAVKLKELGFSFEYLGIWAVDYPYGKTWLKIINKLETIDDIPAPLWQQAFDWFREKHNLFCKIDFFQSDEFEALDYDYSIFDLSKPFKEDGITDNPLIDYSVNETYYFKYAEARQACLEKLIELCKKV